MAVRIEWQQECTVGIVGMRMKEFNLAIIPSPDFLFLP